MPSSTALIIAMGILRNGERSSIIVVLGESGRKVSRRQTSGRLNNAMTANAASARCQRRRRCAVLRSVNERSPLLAALVFQLSVGWKFTCVLPQA